MVKVKDWRGLATRFDKRPDSFMAGLELRGAVIWLRSLHPPRDDDSEQAK